MNLFTLFGTILVDNEKANKSISKTDSLAGKLSKGLGAGIKTAAKWGAGLVAGATAGATALFATASKASDAGDRIDKLSQKIGLSRQGFQEWEYILSQNGTSIEVMQGGMKKLNKVVDQAKQGNDKASESFKRIGVSVDDIKNASPEEAFELTVKALQKMPDGAEKAALANELLGRSGSELMPLLNGTAGSVEELKTQAHEMGLIISDDAVDASAKFTDTMDNVKRSLGAVMVKIGAGVMPIIQSFLDIVMANMPQIQAVMTVVFNAIQVATNVVIGVMRDYLLPIFKSVVNFVKDNWGTIKSVIEAVFDGIKIAVEIIKGVFETVLIPAFQAVINFVKDIFPTIKVIIKGVFDGIKIIISTFTSIITTVWSMFGGSLIGLVKTAWGTIKTTISTFLNGIKSIIKVITSLIKGDWKGVWEGIKGILKGVWNGMFGIVKGALSLIKGVISTVWNGIKTTTSIVWNGIKTAVSLPVNAIKRVVTTTFNGVKRTVTTVWNGIKTAITKPIELAKTAVSRTVEGIKGLFKFKFKWPKIPVPKFSLKGSLNPIKWVSEGLPKLSIRWNAKGAIFKKPTIFDTSQGYQGVGEKGPEAILPINKLQEMINWNVGITKEQASSIIEILLYISEKEFSTYLDGKKVSKGIASEIDKELATLRERRAY